MLARCVRRHPPTAPLPQRRQLIGVGGDDRHPMAGQYLLASDRLHVPFRPADYRPGAMGYVDDVHFQQ